ncbi:HNH endonuclease signature motif containing protein [Nostoc sp. NIES-2111]
MTGAQREMLRGHASALMQELSMPDIASLGGYSDYAAANSQYGRLGRLFAEQLSVDADQLENKVQAMCVAAEQRDASGHFVWRLRPQLLAALQAAGWVEPAPSEVQSIERLGAEAEIASEVACAGLPETTRRALVNARIGQGSYRQRMLLVWGGKCAVTGLALPEALIASHAMAWRDSDNHQRLDEYNGLLLSATLDRLFDTGLVSFADTGRMLAKPALTADLLMACGLAPEAQLRFVPERCKPYLKKHRQRFGFDA